MAKVILLQNIKGVGQIGDVKNVASGHARNFLIPQNLAKLATPASLKEVEALEKKKGKIAKKEKEKNKEIAEKIKDFLLTVEKNVNEEGTLYDKLDVVEISSLLKRGRFKIEPEDIKLEAPVKSLGDYEILINLGHGISAQLKIKVIKKE